MNGIFWAIAVPMILVAFAYLLQPLNRFLTIDRERLVWFSAIPVLLLAALAVGFFTFVENREVAVADRQLSISTQSSAETTKPARKKLGSVASLVNGLAERVKREPNDAGSWLLLAKSYRHLGRPDATADAYSRAVSLGESDPDMETFLADYSRDSGENGRTHGWESAAVEFADRIDEET